MTELSQIAKEKSQALMSVHSDNDVAKTDPLMRMTQTAVESGDIDMVKELLALRDSEDERRAKMAFNSAYSKAQSELPIIPKRGRGHNGITYARIEDIMQGVMPILAKHGLSLRHKCDNENGTIKVTAILSHVDGYSENDTIAASADGSGSKNAIQAIKSTITYLKRATAENILGLASHGEDDDAFAAGASDEAADLFNDIAAAKTVDSIDLVHANIMAQTKLSPVDRKKVISAFSVRRSALLKAEANG